MNKRQREYEERGGTPETVAKAVPDWFHELLRNNRISTEEYDIGLEIREGYRYVTKPVDWNIGDWEKLSRGSVNEASEPPHVLRYYAWCRKMRDRNMPVRKVLDFLADGATCISGVFGRACKAYVEANGWRWRW